MYQAEGTMKIFVMHYSKLSDRKAHIVAEFEKHGITDYEFVEVYDKEVLEEAHLAPFKPSYIKSALSSISLQLKHFHIYRQIAAGSDDSALIFEDDVILAEGFLDKFASYMAQVPEDYDMVFIGDGCGLHIQSSLIQPNINIYHKCVEGSSWGGNGVTRCSDSYVLRRKCAQRMCEYIDGLTTKISLPIDWWINEAARDNAFKAYWAEPTIVTQGSQNGTFTLSR